MRINEFSFLTICMSNLLQKISKDVHEAIVSLSISYLYLPYR